MNKTKIAMAAALLLTLLCMAACGGSANAPSLDVSAATPEISASPEQQAVELTAVPEQEQTPAPEETQQPAQEPDTAARQAFAKALTDLLERQVLPDGTACPYDGTAELSANSFAIQDVDGDGCEELLIVYTTAPMAGQTQHVYGYDKDAQQLHLELAEFPTLTFYQTGVVKADWSHNQGLAGAFWPYSLYRYDLETDGYAQIAMVDAWDKSFAAADAQGNPFPDDVDAEGAGLVYYVMENGVYETDTPISAAAYNAWYAGILGQASVLEVAYTPLTAEAVAAIG